MKLQLNPETNFYENYGIHHVPFWQTTWFWWISIIVSIIVVAVIVYVLGKKIYTWYQKRHRTSWAIALLELELLEKERQMGVSHIELYIDMIEVIKTYLQKRFTISLQHHTPQEMLKIIPGLDVSDEVKKKLIHIFTEASVVLFAPDQTFFGSLDEYLYACRYAVEHTIPQENNM